MVRLLTIATIASVQPIVAAAAQQTVREFLTPPALGEVVSETEAKAREYVQKTPGRHKGHRIVQVPLPLKAGEGKPRYALQYHAWLKSGEFPQTAELEAKEGMSGIGMTRPSSSNYYGGGFIDVRINGQGLGRTAPKWTQVRYRGGALAAVALWDLQGTTFTLTFLKLPKEDFVRVVGKAADTPASSMQVRLRAYPAVTKRTGQRIVWTGSQCREGKGTLLTGFMDTWLLMGDKVYDRGTSKRGAGPCAVMFTPTQLRSAQATVGDYAVDVSLSLRTGVQEFHLALWELQGWPNEKALEHLTQLSKELKMEIGRASAAAVRTDDVPPRAIVADGQPAATIVVAAEPNVREIQAAQELQDYVEKSTGAILRIVSGADGAQGHIIQIKTQEPPEGESYEAFRIKVEASRTTITGNSPIAALYGAYTLLEDGVGVRWYLPGPLGEVVPKHSTLVLPELDVRESPSFPMRWIGRHEWMVRNKQNRCDDGFLIYPGIYHTQNAIVSHRKYFDKRPDFFAQIKGERSEDHQCKLCYSNPDLVREVATNMAAMLDANPNIDLISLSPTDGQLWCECEGCRAMDEKDVAKDRRMSRRSLLFYNAVAAELRKTHPEAKMLVGAYNVYNWPPKDKSIKADPMLNVIITHYENYCLAHPVPDSECPLNKRYVQLIKEWQGLGCGIYYYEYYWKVNWLDLPWPIVHSIRHDFPWYNKEGHQGVYTQYNPDCIWAQFPVHYVAARLGWDVNADVDAIMDKMFDDLFGEAAPHLKAYWALIEKQTAECGRHFPGRGLSAGPSVYTNEVREQMRKHYEAAVAANGDETVALRLEKIGRSLEYVDRLMQYAALKQATTTQPDPEKALTKAREALAGGEALVDEIRKDRAKWSGVVSTSVMSSRGYLGRDVERWRQVVERKKAATATTIAPLPTAWKFALDPDDTGQKQGWFEPNFNDGQWKPIQIGRTWESQGYEHDGFAWYRVQFDVKKEWLNKPVAIHFGAVDGEAWVYWNGKLLGHHKGWDEPFSFPLEPKQIKTDEPNSVAVRVYDGSNDGGIYKLSYLVEAQK